MTQHWIYLSIYQIFIVSNLYPHVSDVSLPAALSLQGGPHNHQIGGLAVQLLEVDSPMFKDTLDTFGPTFVQQRFTETKRRTGTGTDQTENIWKALQALRGFIRIGCNQEYAKQVGFGFSYFFLEILNFVK